MSFSLYAVCSVKRKKTNVIRGLKLTRLLGLVWNGITKAGVPSGENGGKARQSGMLGDPSDEADI